MKYFIEKMCVCALLQLLGSCMNYSNSAISGTWLMLYEKDFCSSKTLDRQIVLCLSKRGNHCLRISEFASFLPGYIRET